MDKLVVSIYESANETCPSYISNIQKTAKLKRGYLHLTKDYYGEYLLIWTFRRNQMTCERVIFPRGLDISLREYWNSGNITYKFLGRRAVIAAKRSTGKVRARDSQRSKCYEWERKAGILRKEILSPADMTKFVRMVTKDYSLTVTKLKFRSGGTTSHARGTWELAFLPCHMTKYIACHEIAHLITTRDHPYAAGHGPEWVTCYMNLLVRYCGFDLSMLKLSAMKNGVKFA